MDEILNELNEMQRKAAEITEGPLLILAGAGSGKTRTVIYRIAHILRTTDIKPYQILALTFTNKAASEMRTRIERFGISYIDEMWMGTFHSICARILRIHAEAIGFTSSFTIYDDSDSKSLLKQCMEECGLNDKTLSADAVGGTISAAKNAALWPDEFLKEYEHLYRARDIATVYTLYIKKLKENNAMDFDDLLLNTYHLFLTKLDILEHYQDRFVQVLVDEYQDTNKLQYSIVSLIAKKHKNICVCGDDDQSIYGWRGADIRNILEFEQDFPKAKVVRLEQNYRSSGNILDAANSVIKHNKSRKGKKLWTESGEGEKIHILESLRDIEEGERVVREINKAVDNEGFNYSEIAVLYRTNAQSRVLEECLIRGGIPYQIVRGTRFYERMEVKDMMAYLKLAVNPYDTVSFARAVSSPKRGIGQACVDKLISYADFKECSVFAAATQADEVPGVSAAAKGKLSSFCYLIKAINAASEDEGLEAAVKLTVSESGYSDYLKLTQPENYESRIDNLNELINAAADFAQSSEDASLSAFLENAALIAGVDNLSDEAGQVLLMSIHNSKGLEFRCVFVAGMEEGLFPLPKACESDAELEEERRLCYVAITRAKEKLFLSYARQRRQYGTTRSARPSRFLGEIPPEYTDARAGIVEDIGEFARRSEENKKLSAFESRPALQTPKKKPKELCASTDFKIADKIMHPTWGVGTVIDITSSSDTILTVAFAGLGVKKIMLGFADIEKVEV